MSTSTFEDHFKEILKDNWKISGKPKKLAGYEDLNYYLKTEEGNSVLVKISRGPFSNDLDFVIKASQFIEKCNTKNYVDIPKVIQSIKDDHYIEFKHKSETFTLRVHTWIPGKLWIEYQPKSSELLIDLGRKAGRLLNLLSGFEYPKQIRDSFEWDLANAGWVENHLTLLDKETEETISKFLAQYKSFVHIYRALPKSIIHNDLNDYNILVHKGKVAGFIDFGDMCHTQRINDLAILLAYAMMFHNDPIDAACDILKGYAEEVTLEDGEVHCLLTLTVMRLAVSTVSAAINLQKNPENTYLQVTSQPAKDLLRKLDLISPLFVEYKFRLALGMPLNEKEYKFQEWVSYNKGLWSKVCPLEIGSEDYHVLDLGIGSHELGHELHYNNAAKHHKKIKEILEARKKSYAIGKYNEIRPLYSSDDFVDLGNQGRRWRTVHLGLDFFGPENTEVYAFADGIIHSVNYNAGDKNYGNTIIIEHQSEQLTFYTLYGHLSNKTADHVHEGQEVQAGDLISWFGLPVENGNWAPHLHFQIILDLLDYKGDFPGVSYIHEREVFKAISPDPTPLFEIDVQDSNSLSKKEILSKRKRLLGRSYSISYRDHLHIRRAHGQYLYDETGRKFLDCVNNVPHVGHQNIRVIEAAQKQMALLNTNTRYLHENIIQLSESLTATLPEPLKVCHFVNSGSEANELAVRMARAFTSRYDIVAMQHGYHGNTNLNVDMSSYKFDGKGGQGKRDFVHIVEMPEPFRGRHKGEHLGKLYIDDALTQLDLVSNDRGLPAAFIAESILSCGGQLCFPKDYLKGIYQGFHDKGIVIIADEVQTGIGRTGEHMWAFEGEGVVPDIVTIGKPFGNGHPLGAVVCTEEIADAFANGMEYFNTFGGNPVSCIIGQTVLDIVEEDKLMKNALHIGDYIKGEFSALQKKHRIIGDVRGRGYFLGWEFILDDQWNPAVMQANYFVNRMKEMGVLLSTDGPLHNVIKFKPPMIFSREDANYMLDCAAKILDEDLMQV